MVVQCMKENVGEKIRGPGPLCTKINGSSIVVGSEPEDFSPS